MKGFRGRRHGIDFSTTAMSMSEAVFARFMKVLNGLPTFKRMLAKKRYHNIYDKSWWGDGASELVEIHAHQWTELIPLLGRHFNFYMKPAPADNVRHFVHHGVRLGRGGRPNKDILIPIKLNLQCS